MKIKEKLKGLKKTTKLIWGVGLVVVLVEVLSVLVTSPEELRGKTVVRGTVIEGGVLNETVSKAVERLNITCNTWEDCPEYGMACGDGYCIKYEDIQESIPNSWLFKVSSSTDPNIKPGDEIKVTTESPYEGLLYGNNLTVGKNYKIALNGDRIEARGNLLWDSQSRKLKDFLVGTYQRNFYLGFPTQLPEGNPLLFYSIPLTIILFFTLLWAIKESFITKLLTTLFVMLAVMPAITLPVPYDLIPFLSIPIEIIAILFAIKLRGKYKGVSHKSSD